MTDPILQNISKIKSNRIILLGCLFLVIYLFNINITSANTGINAQIPYSGNIVKNDGTVLDGTYRGKFIIYNSAVLSDASNIMHQEIRDTIEIREGRFEVLLGEVTPIDTNKLNDDSLWLEIQLNIDTTNPDYEEIFAPRRRIGSALSAINSMRLVANGGVSTNTLSLDSIGNLVFTGDSAIERMRITGAGNLTLTGGSITASALGGSANVSTPGGFDRVLLANSSGQFSQVNLSSLSGASGWTLAGNSTTDAWNGTSGARLGTTSAQPLVLATTNATAQDIRFFTGANGSNERMRITGDGNILINSLGGSLNVSTPSGYDRVVVANSSGQFNQVGISALGSGIWASQSDFTSLQSEIIAARGDRSNLNLRISTISNFASPNVGGNIVGQYYDNAFQATGSGTLAGVANRLDLAPFYTSSKLRIDQIGIAVSTAVASSLAKVVIYSSDSDGWPDTLLYEGDSDLDCSTTGYKFHTLDFTFDSGRQYWLGVRYNSNQTIRAVQASSAVNLGVNGSNGGNYFTILRKTVNYTDPTPATWSFVATDRVSLNPPSIRMRAAALP
jgi:hypothetical protein